MRSYTQLPGSYGGLERRRLAWLAWHYRLQILEFTFTLQCFCLFVFRLSNRKTRNSCRVQSQETRQCSLFDLVQHAVSLSPARPPLPEPWLQQDASNGEHRNWGPRADRQIGLLLLFASRVYYCCCTARGNKQQPALTIQIYEGYADAMMR